MASALISAGGSLLGGIAGGKGASSAAKAQAAAEQSAINLQQQEFGVTQANITPDVNAGNTATEELSRLLGLGDSTTYGASNENVLAQQQQDAALSGVESSPLYTGAYDSGLNAVNQSAAATGGLRGGNATLAQSNFGSSLFSSVLQQMISNLSGVANTGASSAATLAGASQNYANSTSSLLTQQGSANATAAAAPYAAFQQALSGIGQAAGSYANSSGSSDAGDYAAYGWY